MLKKMLTTMALFLTVTSFSFADSEQETVAAEKENTQEVAVENETVAPEQEAQD